MRLCFRVAMKSELRLQVGRGRIAPSTDVYPPDSRAAVIVCVTTPRWQWLLGDLERKGFWARNGEELKKPACSSRSIARAGSRFYRDPAGTHRCGVGGSPGPWSIGGDCRRHIVRSELRERFRTARKHYVPSLKTILIYPTPHWAPHEYRRLDPTASRRGADEDLFDDAVRAIKRSLGGRIVSASWWNATRAGDVAEVPRSAFEHPSSVLPGYAVSVPSRAPSQHSAANSLRAPPRIPAPPPLEPNGLRWCAEGTSSFIVSPCTTGRATSRS